MIESHPVDYQVIDLTSTYFESVWVDKLTGLYYHVWSKVTLNLDRVWIERILRKKTKQRRHYSRSREPPNSLNFSGLFCSSTSPHLPWISGYGAAWDRSYNSSVKPWIGICWDIFGEKYRRVLKNHWTNLSPQEVEMAFSCIFYATEPRWGWVLAMWKLW